MPIKKPKIQHVTKLPSASSSRATKGFSAVASCTPKIQMAMTATISSVQISVEPSQSWLGPRSSISWKAPMATARARKPRVSKRRFSALFFSDRKKKTPQKARIPIGRLMKNTHRQSRLSVSQPPRPGPSSGPSTAPAPQTAMAWPWRSGGLMSSRTAWDNGISAAPNRPCSRRNSTISTRLPAIPHSIDATVKPMIETISTIFRPIRSVRKPVSGVMIVEATM